jgi:hypothetical protein
MLYFLGWCWPTAVEEGGKAAHMPPAPVQDDQFSLEAIP